LRFRFSDKNLQALYTDGKDAHKYAAGVADAFFEVMTSIDAAKDERDLYALKSLRFEKLSGDRKGQHSLRLNRQWRLIVLIERDEQGNTLVVVEIVDYH
jgi:proteic killer suppression protein